MVNGEENLEWVEQHHRNFSHRSIQNISQTQLSQTLDSQSGDESDSAERGPQSHLYAPDPLKRTKEYHIEQAIQAIKLLKAASKPTGWKKVLKHKSGCLVYQSTGNGDKQPTFKGEHVIRGYRAQDVFTVVGVRKLWDDWYDELSYVESYDDATKLMYMVMKSNLSSKTRDISMVERIEMERDGTIYFASCSVDSSKIPRISGKVRADIFIAGWIIQPLPSNPPITKITYIIQTDLLNRLPKFIARRSLAKRPLVITTIETHLRKNGVPMVMSNLVSQTTHRHRTERPTPPHVVTPATPPLTPTTSIDGKDAASDSDASVTSRIKTIPRTPKHHVPVDTALTSRPSSMAFAAYGMRSPSDIMEARRHSTLIGRSASFAPRHSHTARKALAMFKVLASSPEDRWRTVSSDGTFKSYSRIISGAGLPMLRGEGVITGGWSVEQINAVIESSGCRQAWDERFENMSIAETFNSNEYLFHITLKGIGSLTGRDLAGVTIIDRDPQTSALYNVSTSVLDTTIPEDPGRIRALLELSGWSLRPIFDGQGNTVSVNVTYVIQIDIRGTLPNSVVKSISASMMTAVPRLNHFMNKTGYPPYASHIAGNRLFDTFDPKTGHFELCF
ncbi:hypothetical protein EDD21DRAFT_304754, partial [Dissophora ornata]